MTDFVIYSEEITNMRGGRPSFWSKERGSWVDLKQATWYGLPLAMEIPENTSHIYPYWWAETKVSTYETERAEAEQAGPPVELLHVIYSESCSTAEGEPMFWSNEEGWAPLELATRFTPNDALFINPPIEATVLMGLDEATRLVERVERGSIRIGRGL